MSLSPWLGALQVGEGLYGLFNSGNSAAQSYYSAAARDLQQRYALSRELQNMAQNYDPQADTQNSVDFASQTASKSLTQALSNLNAQYESAGGNPGGDTRFNVSAQGAADRVYDPLKTFAAEQSSQDYAKKMAAYEQALAADNGSISSGYMQLGNTVRTDPTSSYGVLASGLRSFMPSAGAGANGADMPYSTTPGIGGLYGVGNVDVGNATYGIAAQPVVYPSLGGVDPTTGTPMAGSIASPFGSNPFAQNQQQVSSDPLAGWQANPGSGMGQYFAGGSQGGNGGSNAPRVGQARTQVSF